MFLKNERSKHKARERYLVVSSDGEWLIIRKLSPNDQLRGREYKVHISECFSTVVPKECPATAAPETSSSNEHTDLAAPNVNSPNGSVDIVEPPLLTARQEDSICTEGLSQTGSSTIHPGSTDPVPMASLDPEPTPSTLPPPRRNPARIRKPPAYLRECARALVSFLEEEKEEEKEEEEERATSGP